MKRLRVMLAEALRFAGTRTFALGLLSVMTAMSVMTISKLAGTVYIVDGNNTMVAFTARNSPSDILEVQGVSASEDDDVTVKAEDNSFYSEIKVERAFDVHLTADGTTRTFRKTDGTVYALLQEAGIEMDGDDLTSLPLDKNLEDGDHIVFNRVEIRSVTENEAIPHGNVDKGTSLLSKGRKRVLSAGKAGEQVLLYQEYVVDGELSDRQLVSTDVIRQPVDQVTLVGDGSEISELDFSDAHPLDASGIPTNYLYVLRGQSATGYSGRSGTYGASGMRCFAGTVAVRSSQFPYGTKFYIATPDRRFVYGYAVANDTGTGLVNDLIDVDLFYPTYEESVLNSRRTVDIYVLEIPGQSQRYPRASVPSSLNFK